MGLPPQTPLKPFFEKKGLIPILRQIIDLMENCTINTNLWLKYVNILTED